MGEYKMTRFACYSAYFTMSSVFCVPALLFVTFRDLYGISYTLLGTLILVNFCTQLGVDLIFSVFSKRFNTKLTVRIMPLITSLGLFIYAIIPMLYPNIAYIGLITGTVIFSLSAGLSEVLLSPVIAALPCDDPQKDMSLLHSLYAFGVFTMVVISTVFLYFFGNENWPYLVMILGALPIIPALIFLRSPMPEMSSTADTEAKSSDAHLGLGILLCVCCIFFGSCAENAMGNWISTFMENAPGITKAVGDVLGVAMFAVLLGLARIGYAKFGKNILRVLLWGMIGAAFCYIVAGVSSNVTVSFFACILTGLFTSMLWPGTLILLEEKIPHAGVAAYALMAAGGDLGAAIAPQIAGIVVDAALKSGNSTAYAELLTVNANQASLMIGMLFCALFPIVGVVLVLGIIRYFKKH
mgnify:CR=1 FL=1